MTLRTAAVALHVVALGALLSAQGPPAATPASPTRAAQAAKAKASPPPPYESGSEARLQAALAAAAAENRRVLIQWGTTGEAASDAFMLTMTKGAGVARTVLYEYEIVRADLGGNARLAQKYQVTTPPHLTVLDAQGKVLASQPAAAFAAATAGAPARPGVTYDANAVNEFLKKHQAAYVAAEPLFNEALARAKKDQKTLFVRFSAPW